MAALSSPSAAGQERPPALPSSVYSSSLGSTAKGPSSEAPPPPPPSFSSRSLSPLPDEEEGTPGRTSDVTTAPWRLTVAEKPLGCFRTTCGPAPSAEGEASNATSPGMPNSALSSATDSSSSGALSIVERPSPLRRASASARVGADSRPRPGALAAAATVARRGRVWRRQGDAATMAVAVVLRGTPCRAFPGASRRPV